MLNKLVAAGATIGLGIGLMATPSLANPATARAGDTGPTAYEIYQGTLSPMNDSGTSGNVRVELSGHTATVTMNVTGAVASQPHAEHIHGTLTVENSCPTMAADVDGNGIVDTAEGVPAYGMVKQSLTTSGDTSADSALAIDRFPTADADGNYTFQRTFDVPEDIATYLGNLHVVVHGIDVNGNGVYDADAGQSSLDPSLPLEATAPAACGALNLTGINVPSPYTSASGHEGQVVRLYTSLFGRAPDAGGFAYFNGLRDKDVSLQQIVGIMGNSPEFNRRFGDKLNNASSSEWVDYVYQAVLGRLADSGGSSFWQSKLDSGTSRPWLVTYFSESPEYMRLTGTR